MARRNTEFSLDQALNQWLDRSGLRRREKVHRIFADWELLAGAALASQTKALRYRRGTLIVELKSAAWRHELMMNRSQLKQRINAHLGQEVVADIEVR